MYAIFTALETELEGFIEKTNGKSVYRWNNYKFVIGSFAGHECIFGNTGIGKVHSAIVVSHIIERYNPSIVFYTGIAGALKSDLNIGDAVIAEDCVQWDVDITSFGFKIGELPSVYFSSDKKIDSVNERFYKSDSVLLTKSKKWSPGGGKVRYGRIITGDSFFSGTIHDEKTELLKELDAYAVDMEGAAAGAACKMYNIPFFLARVISDTVTGIKPKRFKRFMEDSSSKMTELIKTIIT